MPTGASSLDFSSSDPGAGALYITSLSDHMLGTMLGQILPEAAHSLFCRPQEFSVLRSVIYLLFWEWNILPSLPSPFFPLLFVGFLNFCL